MGAHGAGEHTSGVPCVLECVIRPHRDRVLKLNIRHRRPVVAAAATRGGHDEIVQWAKRVGKVSRRPPSHFAGSSPVPQDATGGHAMDDYRLRRVPGDGTWVGEWTVQE